MFSSFLEASHSKALLHCLISYKWVSLASDMGYMLRQCEAPHSPQSVSLGSRLLKWKELMLFSEKAQKTTQTGGPTARSLLAAPSLHPALQAQTNTETERHRPFLTACFNPLRRVIPERRHTGIYQLFCFQVPSRAASICQGWSVSPKKKN